MDNQARDDAVKALESVQPQYEAQVLATLASIEVELGKPADALEHLVRSKETQYGRLSGGDWYALGRLAEHYQLEDIAVGLYRKVEPAPSRGPTMSSCSPSNA